MKTIKAVLFSVVCFLGIQFGLKAQNAWINEIHYDNTGADVDEFIEVVLENPGNYTLSDFSIVLYNGNNGASYDTRTLDQYTVGSTVGNFKFYWLNYTAAGSSIQNGAPDGMALVYQGAVITGQFLSYEGTFTAIDGPAVGMTSVDIGVAESSTTPVGYSLQLSGNGTTYAAFAWQPEAPATPGNLNNNQTLSGTPDPEPTNYPTNFIATPSAFTINLNWTDAIGTQLPAKYLILASEEDNIDLPIDGVPEPDDPNLADGTGALNISYGVQACQFGNLQSNKQFFFKIFPYTNAGSNINYKTDGVPPSATATTPNSVIINYENFISKTFGTWSQKSIIGDTTWSIDTVHGIAGSPCAKVTGFYGGVSHQNEDWLISPSMNFNLYTNEEFSFQTAKNYIGPDLEPLISNDYDGSGNPNNFTWAPLNGTLSSGGWVWTPSGAIDVSGTNGTNVHVAFKFTSTDTESATWEVDEALTTGILIVGIVHEMENIDGFNVVPNPSKGQFNLIFDDNSQKEVQILSISGKEMFTTTTIQASLYVNIQNLPAGIYFVKVISPGTAVVQTKKIIIQ
jgi:Secretion system C-terminal sorting domain